MSRWVDAAKNSNFYVVWEKLLNELDKVVIDDATSPAAVNEFLRLKKVLSIVENILRKTDPEIFPVNIYPQLIAHTQSCLQQVVSYSGNKNNGHLTNANGSADSLFLIVQPYLFVPEQALDSLGTAIDAYTSSVAGYIKSIEESAKKSQSVLSIANGEAVAQKKRIDDIEARVREFNDYLFVDSDGSGCTEYKVKEMVDKVTADHKAVSELHEKLFNGPDSTSQVISGYGRDIQQLLGRISKLSNDAEAEHTDLKKFYQRIFGDSIDGEESPDNKGLKNELDDRLQQLNEYESEQRIRHNAIFDEVEKLIPGASTASLATAYKDLKKSFDKPIRNYTIAFYLSLAVLFFSGFLMVIEFNYEPFNFGMVKASEWTEMLRTLLTRAPLVIPVVWVAVFSATRRSQYERLQQEYAHKEALALSYQSYKKQLQDLQVDAEGLQKELIAKSIEAIAYNASQTLDGKHTEKPPIFQALEKLKLDELKELLNFFKEKSSGEKS